jgi:Fe2+ or Zn2+ uptake regulation protein
METGTTSVKQQPLRMTKQRRVILDQLSKPNVHLSADEIYARVRDVMPNISLGTVYRNLEILSKAGMIKKLNMAGPRSQYDGGMHRHYHVTCRRCGRVSDVSAEPFGDLDGAAEAEGFDIVGHELQFEGVCHECKQGTS